MKINVQTKWGSYDILIQENLLKEVNKHLNLNRKILIVTDDGVPSEYIQIVQKQCKDAYLFTFPQGEKSKNIENYQAIMQYLIQNNFTRSDAIIAIGGGVVGDLSGFVSSTYMRGIDFYNIPTTLLSQVDSSIGGKTAIDFAGIKNIVGTFYQPKKVMIDTATLNTLSLRQVHAGLVESIKMAATMNKDLFYLIANTKDLKKDYQQIIYQSLLIKKQVVEQDEHEKNIRKVLNFGHTVGHAIESYYPMKWLHGECVGMGMLYFSSKQVYNEIEQVLKKYQLPTKIKIDVEELFSLICHDKKVNGDFIDVIYVDNIGEYKIQTLKLLEFKEYLERNR